MFWKARKLIIITHTIFEKCTVRYLKSLRFQPICVFILIKIENFFPPSLVYIIIYVLLTQKIVLKGTQA